MTIMDISFWELFGPIISTLIISVLIAFIILYFIKRKRKYSRTENIAMFVSLSAIFITLSLCFIYPTLIHFFVEPVSGGGEISCRWNNFTYFEKNNTCIFNEYYNTKNRDYCIRLYNDYKNNLTLTEKGIYKGSLHFCDQPMY